LWGEEFEMSQIIVLRTAENCDLPKITNLKASAYSVRGYCSQEGAKEQYLTHKNEFALVARIDEEIVGTMTVTYDRGKLPCDEWFPDETISVRKVSRKVAYYGKLAVEPDLWQSALSIGFALIGEAIARASADGIDAGICIVHPRHVRFYKALGFEEVGQRDNMPGLEKAPAVMLVIAGEAVQYLLVRFKSGAPLLQKKLAA